MKEQQPGETLFDTITYHDIHDIQNLIDGLTKEQALYILTKCVEYSYKNGIFNLIESEVVSKSIRLLNTNSTKQDIVG